jgi:hypothetical protein
MHLVYSVLVGALIVSSCSSHTSERAPAFEFGKLRAELNGNEFTGSFSRDSIIAIWDSSVGQAQIEGEHHAGRAMDELRVTMRCLTLPKSGSYEIRNSRSPVSAEAFLYPRGWQLIWPLRGTRGHAFISDAMSAGRLDLDTVDSANGVIKGRFSVSLRSIDRTPAETVHVRGTFFGRLHLLQHFPGPRPRWAPDIQTDCERIRDAVSM